MGVSFVQRMRKFPDDETARKWFESIRWKDGAYCPYCKSHNVQSNIRHGTMTHRCRDCECRRMFSLRTGTVMQSSKLGYQVWAIAIYLVTTNLNGISSMKLHQDLGITQKTAWHLAHRLRISFEQDAGLLNGVVEVDETYMDGLEGNKYESKKLNTGQGGMGKPQSSEQMVVNPSRSRQKISGNQTLDIARIL